MIPAPHRMKGAALVLGARVAGEIGPFGPYGSDTGDEREDHDLRTEPAGDGTGR
ncbi:hypothetical protein [Streptomyces anulatus]|uniref:hypothetical protein n=1 Tax=Streptomyces anulatus TaxID=1892 RepID=UPI00331FA009